VFRETDSASFNNLFCLSLNQKGGKLIFARSTSECVRRFTESSSFQHFGKKCCLELIRSILQLFLLGRL